MLDTLVEEKMNQEQPNDKWLAFVLPGCSKRIQIKIIKDWLNRGVSLNIDSTFALFVLLNTHVKEFMISNDIKDKIKIIDMIMEKCEEYDVEPSRFATIPGLLETLKNISSNDCKDLLETQSNLNYRILNNDILLIPEFQETFDTMKNALFTYAHRNNIPWRNFEYVCHKLLPDRFSYLQDIAFHCVTTQTAPQHWLDNDSFNCYFRKAQIRHTSFDVHTASYIEKQEYIREHKIDPEMWPRITLNDLLQECHNDTGLIDDSIFYPYIYTLLTPTSSMQEICFVAHAIPEIYTDVNLMYLEKWRIFNIPKVNEIIDGIYMFVTEISSDFDGYDDVHRLKSYFRTLAHEVLQHFHNQHPVLQLCYNNEPLLHPFNFGLIQCNSHWVPDHGWVDTLSEHNIPLEDVYALWNNLESARSAHTEEDLHL